MKPITAFLSAVCLLTSTMPINAATAASTEPAKMYDIDVEWDSANTKLKFVGTSVNKKTEVFNIVIAKYGTDILAEMAKTLTSDKLVLKSVKTSGTGALDVTVGLPTGITANTRCEYDIFDSGTSANGVRRGVVMTYTDTDTDLAAAVSAVNSGTSDAVDKIIATKLVDGTLSAADATKAAQYTVKAKPTTLGGYTAKTLVEAYMKAEGFLRVKANAITAETYADEYAMYIGKTLWKDYGEMTAAEKSGFSTAIKNFTLGDVTDTQKIYNELKFVAKCIGAESADDMKADTLAYFTEIGYSMDAYNNLANDTKRDNVFTKMFEAKATVTDLKSVKALFDSKVDDEAKIPVDSNDYSGGTGSFGGGGGGVGGIGTSVGTTTGVVSGTDTDEKPSTTGDFADMTSHWAKAYAKTLFQKGIISGFPDGSFKPENKITRAEFAKMAVSALNLRSGGADHYSDVTKDAWYYAFVAAATEANLINGDNGMFNPENEITRQDAAVIMARALALKNISLPENGESFTDAERIAEYANAAVAALSSLGVITGDNGEFRPVDSLTRAEASALFVRFCDIMEGNGKNVSALDAHLPEEFKIVELPVKLASLSLDGLGTLALADTDETSVETTSESSYVGTVRYNEAKAILAAVADGDELFDENAESISRGDFLHTVMVLTKNYHKGMGANEQLFGDVPADSEYADDVKAAVDMKIISAGDSFRSDDAITMNEASKIMISALGYNLIAENRGGYPTGYILLATQIGLKDGVKGTGENTISGESMMILMHNFLTTELKGIDQNSDGNGISYTGETNTLLNAMFKIRVSKREVTAVGNHSLVLNADYTEKENYIELDGEAFELEGVNPDMLGKSVRAFIRYENNNKELICVSEDENTEITVVAKDFASFVGTTFKYYDGDLERQANMESAYKVIYNGRKISKWDDKMTSEGATVLRLLDNDDDGKYEILFVDTYSYGTLQSIDYKNKTLGIKLEKSVLDLSDGRTTIELYDAKGNEIEMFRLEVGTTVAIKASNDKRYYEIRVCGDSVMGDVKQINTKDKTMRIDDETYDVSTYFYNKYIKENLVSIGDSVALILGVSGEVVELKNLTSTMKYGYVINCANESGLKDKAKVRIFSADGKIVDLVISDKTKIDGAGSFKSGEVCTKLREQSFPYIVRFGMNASGELSALDFAEEAGDDLAKTYPADNSLRWNTKSASMMYKSAASAFTGYARLNSATVMIVPDSAANLNDETKYEVGGKSILPSGSTISGIDIYDMDENGEAGLVVLKMDITTNTLGTTSLTGYVVEEVNNCSYNDENMRELVCYGDGAWTSLYLPNDVAVSKTSGNDITPGDIIRVKTQNGLVSSIFVDVDFSSGAPVLDSKHGANIAFGDKGKDATSSLSYRMGKVYSTGNGNILISTNGTSFKRSDINVYPFGVAPILFDTATGKVRPLETSEVYTYLACGDAADTVILRIGETVTKSVYIYR